MRLRLAGVAILLVTVGPLGGPGIASAQTADRPIEPERDIPSFRSLFQDIPGDLVNVVRPQTALILGLGGGVSAGVHSSDVRFARDAVSNHGFEEALDPGQVLGGAYVQIGGAVATYLTGRLTRSPRIATLGAELVRAQVVSEVLTEGIKVAVRRRRPDGTAYSFPSGHTSDTFATATVLQREFGWKVGVPAYALASYVAVSRMTENKHYASDIAFGAAIGIVAGRAVKFHTGKHDFALSPMAVPRGAGVSFNLIDKH
jgi:membrane-associated phospholipid phosphatase